MSELDTQYAEQPDDDAVQLSLFGAAPDSQRRPAPPTPPAAAEQGASGVELGASGADQRDDPGRGLAGGADTAVHAYPEAGATVDLASELAAALEAGPPADSLAPEGRTTPQPPVIGLRAAVAEYKEYLVALNRSKHTRESFALDLKLLLDPPR